jgi:heme oxygenase
MSGASYAPPISGSLSLIGALRERTHELHRRAERSGFVRELLGDRIDHRRYAVFLRNLLPAYQALERGLDQSREAPGVGRLARRPLYRCVPLEADLIALAGATWQQTVPLLPVGMAYARRIASAAEGNGARLIAHAYTRYLGDLNGGLILKQRLLGASGIPSNGLSFYDFPDVANLPAFSAEYRAAIDLAGSEIGDIGPVVDEAALAFEFNIRLSDAVLELPGP